jgi:hypothetical protein
MSRSSNGVVRRLALVHAPVRLAELTREIEQAMTEVNAIRREFPELAGPKKMAKVEEARPQRRPMSAAQRRAVSVRMRRYWRERRKASGE